MMTEKDAQGRWCPFTRMVFTKEEQLPLHQAAFNRTHEGENSVIIPHACNCIASGCMAWRWAGFPEPYRMTAWRPAADPKEKNSPPDSSISQYERHEDEADGWFWRETDASYTRRLENWRANRQGFCGLAGAPNA